MNDAPTPCAGRWKLFDADDRSDVIEAKRLCALCPFQVREACLLRTLRFELRAPVKERHGVCGGLSREERYEIAVRGTGHRYAAELRHLTFCRNGCDECKPVPVPVAA